MLRLLLWPHLPQPLSCDSRSETEKVSKRSLSSMSAGIASGSFQMKNETES